MLRYLSLVLAVGLALGLAAPSWGEIIAWDNFAQWPSGGNGWVNGDGWNDTKYVGWDPTGLTFGNSALGIGVFGTGGKMVVSGVSNGLVNPYVRQLATSQSLGPEPLYFSLLLEWVNSTGNAEFAATLMDDNGDEVSSIAFGIADKSGAGQDFDGAKFFGRIGEWDSDSSKYVEAFSDGMASSSTTYLLIGGVTLTDSTLTLKVWALDSTSTSWNPVVTVTKTGVSSWNSIKWWGSKIARMESGDAFYLDEFRVTRNWAEASHTPEPASLAALAGLALSGGLLAWRKQRTRS